MIGDMGGAHDDNFLRAWLAVAFSCFLAPSTSLSISPKSFPAVMDVNGITETNVCQFVVDQLKAAFKDVGTKKNVVCCCVFHLVVSALNSNDYVSFSTLSSILFVIFLQTYMFSVFNVIFFICSSCT